MDMDLYLPGDPLDCGSRQDSNRNLSFQVFFVTALQSGDEHLPGCFGHDLLQIIPAWLVDGDDSRGSCRLSSSHTASGLPNCSSRTLKTFCCTH